MVENGIIYNKLIESYSKQIAGLEKEEVSVVTKIEELEPEYKALASVIPCPSKEYRNLRNKTWEELHGLEQNLRRLRELIDCYRFAIHTFEIYKNRMEVD